MYGYDDFIDDGLDKTTDPDALISPAGNTWEGEGALSSAQTARLARDVARRAWSFAVMAALGFFAIAGACVLAFAATLPNAPFFPRVLLAVALVAAPLGIALKAQERAPRSRLFFAISQLFFGPALAFVATDASLTLGSAEFWNAYADALLETLGPWTFAVLFFVCVLRTRGVCYLAAAIALVWETTSESNFASIAVLFLCAAGVFRAWRLSSRSVATLFGALCCWTFLSRPDAWSALTGTSAPMGVVLAFFLFWYGAAYKNAAMRGVGLSLGGAALAWASTPSYWIGALGDGASVWISRLLLSCSTLFFIAFCGHMLLSGAHRSAWRFGLGATLATGWTCYMATRAWGTYGPLSSCLLLGVAGLTFGLIFKLEWFLAREGSRFSEKARRLKAPTTDAMSDSPESRDFADMELAESQDVPPSATETACRLALADLWGRTRRKAQALGACAELVAILLGRLLHRIS